MSETPIRPRDEVPSQKLSHYSVAEYLWMQGDRGGPRRARLPDSRKLSHLEGLPGRQAHSSFKSAATQRERQPYAW